MRVLLTGAAGFIGSHVAELLLAEGHSVVGIDDVSNAYDPRLKEHRLGKLAPRRGFRLRRGDVSVRADVEAVFADGPFDAVLNLAARAGVRQSLANPWAYVDANVIGTVNLLEACRAHDVPRLVLASTSSVYGSGNPQPFHEELSTDRPLSPYAASKKAAELFAATYAHAHGLHVPVLRFFTVYGPAGRPDMSIFRFVRWTVEGEPVLVHGDGTQTRDFTYVEDVARGIVAASRVEGFEVINLGGDRPHSLNEVVAAVERAAGRKADVRHGPPHPADVPATWADISKARRLLGWEPRISLDAGVASTVEWYVKNREWARDIEMGEI